MARRGLNRHHFPLGTAKPTSPREIKNKSEHSLLELLIAELPREPIVALAVLGASNRGSTTMWNSVFEEAREVAWLVSIVGGLSVAAVGLAVALAAA
jgi:hypothetical protein